MQRAECRSETVPQAYEDLVQPHVDSFDYFLGPGMEAVVSGLEPIEVWGWLGAWVEEGGGGEAGAPSRRQRYIRRCLCGPCTPAPAAAPADSAGTCCVCLQAGHCLAPPPQIEHPLTNQRHRFWFENAVVGRPVREDAGAALEQRLLPRECREAVRASVARVAVAAASGTGPEIWAANCLSGVAVLRASATSMKV